MCIFAIAIIVRLISVQYAEPAEWKQMAENFVTEYRDIPAARGNIYAEDGSLLATTIPKYDVFMDLTVKPLTDDIFNNNVDSLSRGLSKLLPREGKSALQFSTMLKEARKNKRRYQKIAKNIDYNQVQELKKLPIFNKGQYKGGVIFEKENVRLYPFGELAKRTIGTIKKDPTEKNEVGLEGYFDETLSGVNGKRLERNIIGGQWIPVGDQNDVEPTDGADLVTSIDINIQDVAHNALKQQLIDNEAEFGTVVMMEVETGFIKAISNLGLNKQGNYVEGVNHAVGGKIEPGSTFKLASLLALLEEGVATINDTVDTKNGRIKFYDRTMRDSNGKGYGKITLAEAFAKSTNVGISSIVNESFKNNPQQFVDRLYAMGLGHSLDVSIIGEKAPFIKNTSHENWSGTTLPWMSIGYEVNLTPLQILAFYNAVANDGKLMKPQLVTQVKKDGQIIKEMKPVVLNERIASQKSIDQAKELLELVVEEGTAKNLSRTAFQIAGKTGTAQIAKDGSYTKDGARSYQASFVGYFPAENPKYSCMVLVSSPSKDFYYGNQIAGPVFKETAEKIYAKSFEIQSEKPEQQFAVKTNLPVSKNGLQHDLNEVFASLNVPVESKAPEAEWIATSTGVEQVSTNRIKVNQGRVPNVVGMGLSDAIYLLESQGLQVLAQGKGTVVSQTMTPGYHVPQHAQILIELKQ